MRGLVRLDKIRDWYERDGINVILAPDAVLQPLLPVKKEALAYA